MPLSHVVDSVSNLLHLQNFPSLCLLISSTYNFERMFFSMAFLFVQAMSVIRTNKKAIYTAGRPPWYNEQGELKEAFVIGKNKIL